MPRIRIERLRGEAALEHTFPLLTYAFRNSPPLPTGEDRKQTLRYMQSATASVLFEDDVAVACSISTPMEQNVRGRMMSANGVWGVAVHPNARRKGYARRTLLHMMAADRENGRALSMLYAFRESFYDRLGYALFPQPRQAVFSPAGLAPLLRRELGGRIILLTTADAHASYDAYLRQRLPQAHGMGLFQVESRAPKPGQENWLALAQANGDTIGVMTYNIKSNQDLTVHSFFYDNSQGKYLLLEWLARHIDQVATVKVTLPPFEQPETWLPDLDISLNALEPPLGRVLDIDGLAGLPSGPGAFTARIIDAQCPWNEGTYRFESVDGTLSITPAEIADCELHINALAALIYGTQDPGDFDFRGWGQPSAATQAIMSGMFPRTLPYLHIRF